MNRQQWVCEVMWAGESKRLHANPLGSGGGILALGNQAEGASSGSCSKAAEFSKAELFYIFSSLFFFSAVQGRRRRLLKNVYLSS